MGVLSHGCNLGAYNKKGLEPASIYLGSNGYHPHHGSVSDGEANEAVAGFGSSSADLDEVLGDSSLVVKAVQVLLQGLGEDIHRVGLVKTPLRVARAFAFATKGYRQVAKDLVGDAMFPEAGVEVGSGLAGGMGGMVVVRNIDQFSLCSSCLLPFKVSCHIAYIASGYQVVGLSKLARVADMYARRLQDPQTLADQICQGLSDTIQPLGVAVALQSWHPPVPGCHQGASFSKSVFPPLMVSFAGRGQFEDKSSVSWKYFLAMLCLEGISISKIVSGCDDSGEGLWCPCAKLDVDAVDGDPISNRTSHYCNGNSAHSNGTLICNNGSNGKSNSESGRHFGSTTLSAQSTELGDNFLAMVAAVESMIDVLRGGRGKENHLLTAKCYTRWLLHFRKEHPELELTSKDNCINGLVLGMNGPSLPVRGEVFAGNGIDAAHTSVVMTELDVPFCSLCEHHLLPFFGKAHFGYYASEVASGGVERSAVMRIVEALGHRLQVQERLTREIAEVLMHRLKLRSIIVVLEASHTCMVSRGVEKLSTTTATQAMLGCFATDDMAKMAFLEKIHESRKVGRTSF